jgi:imidazolonepropionase-like amidohydrolase
LAVPAALSHTAKMLRMEGKIGVIAPGAFADLLVLDANPLVFVRTDIGGGVTENGR